MIFRRLAEDYHFTMDQILDMGLNQIRVYLADEKILGKTMRFDHKYQYDQFREATKARGRQLARSIVDRVMGGR